ncbi:MCE family protein [Rugosimonospora africana]|uniref:ABC transporter substrate-binding protein n=1 Tax=Rugosimonospora africana TaxID=556532 RepID=A0A8J3QWZ4_9ACTN|nr:MCE family protein [Rugosimonospora africana]GIH18423.1 ABC transporter substrate-binding protein [Rugosimonospora africana]
MRRKSIAGPLTKGIIFVIVTVLATAVLGLTIANAGVGDTTGYRAEFTDVTGLNPGDDVRIAGVRVGQVTGIQVIRRRYAEVRFSVERGRRLPASVTATIKYRNLVGQRYIALGQGVGPVNATLAPDHTIPLSRTTPALDLTELFNGFQPLFQALSPNDVNQLSTEIVQVFQGEDTTVDSLVSHTASLTTTLAAKDEVIGQLIDNLNAVLTTVNSRGDELSGMVTTLQELVSGLADDRKPIGDAISAMSTLTTSTAGLLQDARGPLSQDIDSLGDVSTNLADAQPALDQFLKLLPLKLNDITTLASYGSWLNFYLCTATVGPVGVIGGPPLAPPIGVVDTGARCQG